MVPVLQLEPSVVWAEPLGQTGFIVLPQKIGVLGQGRKVAQRRGRWGVGKEGGEGAPDWREVEWAWSPAEDLSLLSLPSAPKEAAPGDPGPSSITFFAFSLIEGYISIVMDAETQKKYVTPDRRWVGRRCSARPREEGGGASETLKSPVAPASPGSPVTCC